MKCVAVPSMVTGAAADGPCAACLVSVDRLTGGWDEIHGIHFLAVRNFLFVICPILIFCNTKRSSR